MDLVCDKLDAIFQEVLQDLNVGPLGDHLHDLEKVFLCFHRIEDFLILQFSGVGIALAGGDAEGLDARVARNTAGVRYPVREEVLAELRLEEIEAADRVAHFHEHGGVVLKQLVKQVEVLRNWVLDGLFVVYMKAAYQSGP